MFAVLFNLFFTYTLTTMKPVIDWISLGVSDLQKSLVFYRDGLGFPTQGIVAEYPGTVSFRLANEQILVLHEWSVFSTFMPDPSAPLKPGGCNYNQYADSKEDVHRVVDSAVQAGGKQIGGFSDQPWGYVASVLDPDGHQWVIFYSPAGRM